MENVTANNWNDALVKFGLDYSVEKRPLTVLLGEGKSQVVDNLFAMVRSDTNQPLPGVAVNGRYCCIQTQSYADIGNKICGQLGATFVRGGTLLKGGGLYMQAKLPDSIRVKGSNDVIDKLLTFITSHDGRFSFMAMATTIRLFCENQMNALMRDAVDAIKIRHTASCADRLAEADQVILDSLNAYKAFEQKINFLADQRFTDLQLDLAAHRLFGVADDVRGDAVATRTKNNIEKIKQLADCGEGSHMFRGTAYSALQGFTNFIDHGRSVNKDTDLFEASLIGSGATMRFKAVQIIDQILAG